MKNYLSFSRNERNGLLFMVLILLGYSSYNYFNLKNEDLSRAPLRLQKIEKALQSIEQEHEVNRKYDRRNSKKKSAKFTHNDYSVAKEQVTMVKKETIRFPFDPNTASIETLLRLGFTSYAAHNLRKYLDKGGKIQRASDLKKIYGISEKDYLELKPFVNIKSPEVQFVMEVEKRDLPKIDSILSETKKPVLVNSKFEKVEIDINKATEEEWQQLYGIGPAFAARIVKYRTGLGGFHDISQLSEVYGLPDSTFQSIKNHLNLDQTYALDKIAINTIDYETLKRHYYIDYKMASILVNFRTQHGSYSSIEDLRKIKIITPEFLNNIGPYLDFND